MRSFRPLLKLLTVGALGRLPFITLPVAALLLVDERIGLGYAGIASGALSLGAGLIGLLVGRLLDGPRAGRVLAALTLAHIPAVAAFIAWSGTRNLAVLLPVSLAAGFTVPPVAPVVRALLAQRTDQADATRVFAFDSIAVEIAWIGGPLLVSIAVILGGPALAVSLSPGFAMIGVAAVYRERPGAGRTPAVAGAWLTRRVVRLLLSFAVTGTGFRLIIIAIAAISTEQGRPDASGVLLAIWAAGGLVGGLWAARGIAASTWQIGVAQAVTLALVGIGTNSIWVTAILVFVSGVPSAPFVAALTTLVSLNVAERAHARAFAAMQAGSTIFAAIGAAAGGELVDRFGPASVTLPAGVLLLVSAALARVPVQPRVVTYA